MAKKKTKKKSKSYWKKKCDVRWSEIIRSVGHCEVCKHENRQLHAHHLISRAAIFFRHTIDNGICLCAHCHNFSLECSPHASPWAFEDWMALEKPEQYYWWSKNRYKVITGQKIDYEAVFSVLKELP